MKTPKINQLALARAIARAKGLKRYQPFLAKIKANKRLRVKGSPRYWRHYINAALTHPTVIRFYKQEIGK